MGLVKLFATSNCSLYGKTLTFCTFHPGKNMIGHQFSHFENKHLKTLRDLRQGWKWRRTEHQVVPSHMSSPADLILWQSLISLCPPVWTHSTVLDCSWTHSFLFCLLKGHSKQKLVHLPLCQSLREQKRTAAEQLQSQTVELECLILCLTS